MAFRNYHQIFSLPSTPNYSIFHIGVNCKFSKILFIKHVFQNSFVMFYSMFGSSWELLYLYIKVERRNFAAGDPFQTIPKGGFVLPETHSKPWLSPTFGSRGEESFAATFTPPRGRRRGVAVGSASCLFRRPLPNLPEGRLPLRRHSLPLGGDGEGLLSEAPCAYRRSALRLFRKRLALIPEAHGGFRNPA